MSCTFLVRFLCAMSLILFVAAPVWAQALSGTYTVNNAGGADYNDLGAAFVDIENNGLADDTIIEVQDSGNAYQSNANYKLDAFNNNNGQYLLTIRAAAGHNPVFEGAGARSGFTTAAMGTISLDAVDNVVVEGLYITGGNEFGIMYYNSSRVTIRRCVVWDCAGAGIFGYGNSFMEDCTITHNYIYNCPGNSSSTRGQASLAFRRADSGTVVTHNTVVRTSGGSGSIGVICNNSSGQFNELSNNIFYNTSPNTITFQLDSVTGVAANADGNCFYLGSNTSFADSHFPTYQDWLNAGWDANGIDQDPQLASTSTPYDLDLTPGSPCIGAGITGLATSDYDIYGNPYSSPPAIGAHELAFPPSVSGISSPQVDWLDVLTISGSDLDGPGLVVTIGGEEAAVLSSSSSQLEVEVADGTPTGNQVIEVTTAGGSDNSQSVDVSSIPPVLNSATPDPVGWVETLVLQGVALRTTNEVRIDGEPVPVDSTTSGEVTVTIPDAAETGTMPVEVTSDGGTSNTISVTISTAPPQISWVAPSTVLWLDALEISGSALTTATEVTIGEVGAEIISSGATSLEVTVSDATPLGSQPVVVTTEGGSESSTVVVNGIAPIPTEAAPQRVPRGSTLTITGNALANAESVHIGEHEVEIESNSAHEIQVAITSAVPKGEAPVMVTTEFGSDDNLMVDVISSISVGERGCAIGTQGSSGHWGVLLTLLALLGAARRRRPATQPSHGCPPLLNPFVIGIRSSTRPLGGRCPLANPKRNGV